jgi:hypothetical protein
MSSSRTNEIRRHIRQLTKARGIDASSEEIDLAIDDVIWFLKDLLDEQKKEKKK